MIGPLAIAAILAAIQAATKGVSGWAEGRAQDRATAQGQEFQREQGAFQRQGVARSIAMALEDRRYAAERERVGRGRRRNSLVNALAGEMLFAPLQEPRYANARQLDAQARKVDPSAFNYRARQIPGAKWWETALGAGAGIGGAVGSALMQQQALQAGTGGGMGKTNLTTVPNVFTPGQA